MTREGGGEEGIGADAGATMRRGSRESSVSRNGPPRCADGRGSHWEENPRPAGRTREPQRSKFVGQGLVELEGTDAKRWSGTGSGSTSSRRCASPIPAGCSVTRRPCPWIHCLAAGEPGSAMAQARIDRRAPPWSGGPPDYASAIALRPGIARAAPLGPYRGLRRSAPTRLRGARSLGARSHDLLDHGPVTETSRGISRRPDRELAPAR